MSKLVNLEISKWTYCSFIVAEKKLRSIHCCQVGNAYYLFHFSTRVTTPTSAPKRANTWFTLSKRKVFLPCSNSRTKRSPTPARIANSGCVGAVRKVSKSLLHRYTLLKFQTLVKLITLIINSFCSMLCGKASDSWVCAANAHINKTFRTPSSFTKEAIFIISKLTN